MRAKSIAEQNTTPRVVCTAPWRVKKVSPIAAYRLEIEFIDGTYGVVDLTHKIMSEKAGVFAALKDCALFKQVFLEYNAVTWPNGVDLAPDAMYRAIKINGTWILE